MPHHTLEERVIALAAIFQATAQVDRIARTGMTEAACFETSIRSLFIMQPAQTIDIYGTPKELHLGLSTLLQTLGSGTQPRNPQIMRYSLSLLQLERHISRSPTILNTLGQGIEQTMRQVDHFSITHESVIAALADLYSAQISPLSPRIMVEGSDGHLSNPANAAKIRALLLAGMRATILWRQCGGTRWQLLFNRRRHMECATSLIQHS